MPRIFRPKPAPFRVGEPLPQACNAHDLTRVFGRSLGTIYDWERDGKLRRFELHRPLGTRKWSGKLLQKYVDGGAAALSLLRKSA
jgi:hypothetical protein